MSFVAEFNSLAPESFVRRSLAATPADVRNCLSKSKLSLADFAGLLSPAASGFLGQLSLRSQKLTQQRFGKVVRLFAPLYLSNECVNNCHVLRLFPRQSHPARDTFRGGSDARGAGIARAGFPQHPAGGGRASEICLEQLFGANVWPRCTKKVPASHSKSGRWKRRIIARSWPPGADGLVVYQETYDRSRLCGHAHRRAEERILTGGWKRPSALTPPGFAGWASAAFTAWPTGVTKRLRVAAHADYLLRHCWKAQVTISLPRLRPCAGEFQPLTHMSDRELAQLICAFRLMFPDVGWCFPPANPPSCATA